MISAQNLLKLISNFTAKSQDTKSMCRNHRHFYTPITDKQRAKSKVNSHSFTIAKKRIKYLGKQLTKGIKDPFKVNYKPLLKEIREETNKC